MRLKIIRRKKWNAEPYLLAISAIIYITDMEIEEPLINKNRIF